MDSLEDSVFLIEEKLEKYMTLNSNCNQLYYRYEHMTIINLEWGSQSVSSLTGINQSEDVILMS